MGRKENTTPSTTVAGRAWRVRRRKMGKVVSGKWSVMISGAIGSGSPGSRWSVGGKGAEVLVFLAEMRMATAAVVGGACRCSWARR